VADADRDHRADRDRSAARKHLDPADIELLPRAQCVARAIEISLAAPDDHVYLVDIKISARRLVPNEPDGRIRQGQINGLTEEAIDQAR
jgi:hypothetical protein